MIKTGHNAKLFIVYVYVLFWVFLLLAGGMILLFGDIVPMQLFFVVGSWTPTIVLLIMFNKLLPNTTRKEFFKKLFKPKLNWQMLSLVTIIQILVVLASIFILSLQTKSSMISMLNLSFPILSYAFFTSLITGATGEESAWRGYLFPIMTKRSGVIKGSMLLGVIWGFWHAPLWFVTSGFTGINLVIYIASFFILIVAISVIIGICYNHNKNIIVPIWIHLILNFSMSFYAGSANKAIDITIYIVLLYVPIAFGFYLWHKRKLSIA